MPSPERLPDSEIEAATPTTHDEVQSDAGAHRTFPEAQDRDLCGSECTFGAGTRCADQYRPRPPSRTSGTDGSRARTPCATRRPGHRSCKPDGSSLTAPRSLQRSTGRVEPALPAHGGVVLVLAPPLFPVTMYCAYNAFVALAGFRAGHLPGFLVGEREGADLGGTESPHDA